MRMRWLILYNRITTSRNQVKLCIMIFNIKFFIFSIILVLFVGFFNLISSVINLLQLICIFRMYLVFSGRFFCPFLDLRFLPLDCLLCLLFTAAFHPPIQHYYGVLLEDLKFYFAFVAPQLHAQPELHFQAALLFILGVFNPVPCVIFLLHLSYIINLLLVYIGGFFNPFSAVITCYWLVLLASSMFVGISSEILSLLSLSFLLPFAYSFATYHSLLLLVNYLADFLFSYCLFPPYQLVLEEPLFRSGATLMNSFLFNILIVALLTRGRVLSGGPIWSSFPAAITDLQILANLRYWYGSA